MRDFIDDHCRSGGRAVVLDRTDRGDMIVIRHGRRSMQLAWTHLLPSTFGGTAQFNVANAMAAAGAAFASGAGLHEIRQGLRTFTTSYYLSPGRMTRSTCTTSTSSSTTATTRPGCACSANPRALRSDEGRADRPREYLTDRHDRDRRRPPDSDMRGLARSRRALRRRGGPRRPAAAWPGARVHRGDGRRGARAGSASPGCAAARSRSCSTRRRRCATSWPAPTRVHRRDVVDQHAAVMSGSSR